MARAPEWYLAAPLGRGQITPSMVPEDGDDGEDRVSKLLTEVQPLVAHLASPVSGTPPKSPRDDATDHYVYWQVYLAVYTRMLGNPSSGNLNAQGGAAWTDGQRDSFWQLSERHRLAFELAVMVDEAPPSSAPILPPSRALDVQTSF